MKRTPLGTLILAGMILALTVPYVAGRGGPPEKVSLAALKTDLLRKMVQAHAADFAKDKAREAKVKTLTDTLGGTAGVVDKLNYNFKDGKPSLELDATKVTKTLSPAEREATFAAVGDLLGYSLGKVSDGSVVVGDKKYTIAKDDVKTLTAAVRVLWPAAPVAPPADPTRALALQLAQLAKDLENLKKLDARIGKLEKDAPGLSKKIDDLAGEVKKLGEAIKPLDKLKDVPAGLDKVEKAVGKLAPAVQKLEEALKKLDALPGQIKTIDGQIKAVEAKQKANDEQFKALTERASKQEKGLADTNGQIKALTDRAGKQEKGLADTNAALKKQGDDLKKQADDLKKQADDLKKQSDDLKKHMADAKTQADEVKKQAAETRALAEKLNKANDSFTGLSARIKVLEDQAKKDAAERKRLEEQSKKDAEHRKKLEDRLKKIESILFPPPPPPAPDCPCPCQVVDQGYYVLKPGCGRGCYGESFPVLTPVWVPCPVLVPVQPSYAEEKPGMDFENKEKPGKEIEGKGKAKEIEKLPIPPKQEEDPTEGGPRLPETTPVSVMRTVSAGERPTKATLPTYYIDGLKASDAPAIFWQGKKLFEAGQHAEAQARFDAAIKLADNDARYWYFKSLSESARGEKSAAAKSLHRAVGLHLQGKPTQVLIGESLERVQGKPRQQLREALDAQRVSR